MTNYSPALQTLAQAVAMSDIPAVVAAWKKATKEERTTILSAEGDAAEKFAKNVLNLLGAAVLRDSGIVAAVRASAAEIGLPTRPIGKHALPGYYLTGATPDAGYVAVTIR